MAGTQFSPQELFILRNHIPIKDLMKTFGIPFQTIDGVFRFCCPVCKNFHTGVNPEANLARCFDCKKNYNTIDLAKLMTGSGFVQSVRFLKRFLGDKDKSILLQIHPKHKTSTTLVSVGDVLKSIGTIKPSYDQHATNIKPVDDIHERIRVLEQQVELLTQKIKRLDTRF